MSDQPKDKPEGTDWDSATPPQVTPAQPNPSPEDVNITPQTTPKQSS